MSWNHVCRFGTQGEIVENAKRYGAGPGGLVVCLANPNEYSAWSNLDETAETSGTWDTFTAQNDEEIVRGLNERGVAPGNATVTLSGDHKRYVVLFYTAGVDTVGIDMAGTDMAGIDTTGTDTAGVATTGIATATITLDWGEVHQEIDGFGAFAGRAVPFFEAAKRDVFMEHLWGKTGLQLNMIRGEVLHTYPFDKTSGVVTIKPAGVSIDDAVNSLAYRALTCHQKEHLAQLWILKKARERHQVPIIFASAWTPPLEMKTDPSSVNARWFNGLNYNCCSDDFASYLAGFAKSCRNEGIGLYGISPSNEPENILAPWPSSFWPPPRIKDHLGEFISSNLRPKLAKLDAAPKIIAPENAAWGTAKDLYLPGMDVDNVDILAAHGYAELLDAKREPGLNQKHSSKITTDKHVWVTEACDAGRAYDDTMTGGLRLAINIHKFLTECNVNAYMYWLGMLDFNNNESLLGTNPDGSISCSKTYYIMGQYSRYVHAGYQRFGTQTDNSKLKVSAYKDPEKGEFSVVVVNPGESDTRCKINLSGFTAGRMKAYLTSDSPSAPWQPSEVPQTGGSYEVTVPRFSVISFTGTGMKA